MHSLARERRTIIVVWLALCAVTLLNWRLTPVDADATTRTTGLLVSGIAVLGLVKSRLVIRFFMEVRHAPRWLRLATDAWLAVLWTTLLVTFLISL